MDDTIFKDIFTSIVWVLAHARKCWCFAGIYGGLWQVIAHGDSTVQTEKQ